MFDVLMDFRRSLWKETDRGCALMAAEYLSSEWGELLRCRFVDDGKACDANGYAASGHARSIRQTRTALRAALRHFGRGQAHSPVARLLLWQIRKRAFSEFRAAGLFRRLLIQVRAASQPLRDFDDVRARAPSLHCAGGSRRQFVTVPIPALPCVKRQRKLLLAGRHGRPFRRKRTRLPRSDRHGVVWFEGECRTATVRLFP